MQNDYTYQPIRACITSYFTFGPDGPNNGESPWPDKTTSGAVNSGQLYKKSHIWLTWPSMLPRLVCYKKFILFDHNIIQEIGTTVCVTMKLHVHKNWRSYRVWHVAILFSLSIRGQTHEFILYVTQQWVKVNNFKICHRKSKSRSQVFMHLSVLLLTINFIITMSE